MPAENEPISAQRRLTSWKEIAAYVGRDERTVKRWEASRGLPVRRVPGASQGSVFAYAHEIEDWLRGHANAEPASSAATKPARGPKPFVLAVLLAPVAIAVVAMAVLRIVSAPPARVTHVPSADARAFYAEGLYAWQTRTPAGLARAVDDFTQAIVRDPQYARAYAGLAACYNLLREYTTMAPEDAFPRAKAAAERAIALDPSLADAHAALGFVDFYWLRDVKGARHEFERALALAPGSATAHHWYATVLMTIRQFPQALSEIGRAETLDPESTAIRADKGLILFFAGRGEEAIALLRQLEQTGPNIASQHRYLAVIDRARGDDTGYLAELAASADVRHDETDRAVAAAGEKGLAAGGHRGMLLAILAAQRQLFAEGRVSAYAIAETQADLGDRAAAFHSIRVSLNRHESDNVALAIDPAFAFLRPDPEFRRLAAEAMTPRPDRTGNDRRP